MLRQHANNDQVQVQRFLVSKPQPTALVHFVRVFELGTSHMTVPR